jgi:hypothetical protein
MFDVSVTIFIKIMLTWHLLFNGNATGLITHIKTCWQLCWSVSMERLSITDVDILTLYAIPEGYFPCMIFDINSTASLIMRNKVCYLFLFFVCHNKDWPSLYAPLPCLNHNEWKICNSAMPYDDWASRPWPGTGTYTWRA